MNLESPVQLIDKSQESVYNFLMHVENYEQLMPENTRFEKISDTRFLFGLKGMPEIVLDLREGIPHHTVILGAASDKIPFTLTANLKEIAAEKTEVQLAFEGTFNAMMAMMVKGPITKFIGTLSENMKSIA